MHTPLLRTLALGLLVAVLAACSSIDEPTTDAELETTANFVGGDLIRPGDPVNGVCFYAGSNFSGAARCYTSQEPVAVSSTTSFARITPSWNDRISSLVVAPGYDIVMYPDAEFQGRPTVAGNDTTYRRAPGIPNNNNTSSFRIIRTN